MVNAFGGRWFDENWHATINTKPWRDAVGAYVNLLKQYGTLWIGTLGVVNAGTYLHSRIVEGMRGNGSADSTWMKIVDPESGDRR